MNVTVWVTAWPVPDWPVATAVLVPHTAGTSTGSSIKRVVGAKVVGASTVTVNETVPFVAGTDPTTTPLTVLVTGGEAANPQAGVNTIVKVSPTVWVPANCVPVQGGGVTMVTATVSAGSSQAVVTATLAASPL